MKPKEVAKNVAQSFWNPPLMFLVGGIAGVVLILVSVVRPMQESLNQRAESLREWERLIQIERETVATIKNINVEQLKEWISTSEESSARFAELQRRLHERELRMTGGGWTYLALTVVALLGAAGFGAFVARDANANSARSWESAISYLPAIEEELYLSLNKQDKLTVAPEADKQIGESRSISPDPPIG